MKFFLLAAFLFVAMMAVMAVQLEEPSDDSFSDLKEHKVGGSSKWLCNAACWSKGKAAGVWEGDDKCVCLGNSSHQLVEDTELYLSVCKSGGVSACVRKCVSEGHRRGQCTTTNRCICFI